MGAISSINILFRADLKQFSSEIQNASREMKKYGNQLQGIGNTLSIGLTLPIVAAGAASIKMASDYNESLNKVDVAFKNSSSQVKEFAKDSLTSFGIAEGTALDMAATYGDMATSMGLNTQQASKMSTSLVGLAGDLASFKNISIDVANTAISSIFTGETESIKKLGIVMTEANLQAFALSKGITKQYKDFSQAEKVQLRYAYVMANTTNAQGDFVRTGGGAANQMRIFQESLKQLGQQFGAVILPAFTKLITSVNGIIKGFSELSPATKETIVIIAGVAAAIGPLLTGVGKLLTFLPNLALAVKSVGTSFAQLQAFAVANPYIALGAAIAVIAGGLYLWYSNQKEVISSQQALNNAIAEGNKNAASEVASLDTLYKTATNVKLSINERKKAVDELQALYPAYFKNITDEAILNGTATKSYNELREAIFNKSRAVAIDAELQSRANERIKKELELRQKIKNAEENLIRVTNLKGDTFSEGSFSKGTEVVKSKQQAVDEYRKTLLKFKNDLKQFTDDNKKADELLFSAKEEYFKSTEKLTKNEIDLQGQIVIGTNAVADANNKLAETKDKVFTPGTIAYYENEISKLKQQQAEVSTSEARFYTLGNEIQRYLDLIEKIQPARIEPLQSTSVELSTPNLGIVTESVDKMQSDLTSKAAGLKTTLEGIKLDMEAFNASISETMNSAVSTFAEGFAQIIGSWQSGGNVLQGIGSLFLGTLADMMIQVGKIAIQTGIAITGIKAALKSLNPALAIGAGVALIALGTLVKSQMADAGGFANGGVVGGTSTFGDKLFARVNSGEMILNKGQQRNLANMINPAVSAGDVAIQLMGGFEVEGSKLRLVLDRADKKKERIG